MPPKRPAMSPSVAKKTRKSLTLEVKMDSQTREARKLIALLATIFTSSTVSTIFKSADLIKKAGSSLSRLCMNIQDSCCLKRKNISLKRAPGKAHHPTGPQAAPALIPLPSEQ
ncbi:hypothetical protein E2C01_024457 [Portunus trituberculatus]|uniref:Uncharacterized protein n=1 Tax=Portunus trituberculatus TaxID=210409 RepID=A0A5B7ECR7_PORTR|nr:hypothetical protein [Portunus trituberculatus]